MNVSSFEKKRQVYGKCALIWVREYVKIHIMNVFFDVHQKAYSPKATIFIIHINHDQHDQTRAQINDGTMIDTSGGEYVKN